MSAVNKGLCPHWWQIISLPVALPARECILFVAAGHYMFVFGVSSPARNMWVDPPNLHADFSHITDPEDESLVTVTAVDGPEESDAAPADGITFSYYKETLLQQKCECLLATTEDSAVVGPHMRFPPCCCVRTRLSLTRQSGLPRCCRAHQPGR